MSTDLTAKFEAFEAQVAAEHTATLAKLTTMEETIGLLNTALDTLNNNGATNTRYLLAAIGANSPCTDCEGNSLIVPPLSNDPLTISDELCQRSQALLAAIGAIVQKFDILSNFGVGFNVTNLRTAFSEIISGLGEPSTVPGPSYADMTSMASWSISFATSNFLDGNSLYGYFNSVIFALRDAIYSAASPSAAKSAYSAVLSAQGWNFGVAQLLDAIGYADLFNYYLDPASDVNLSPYDGSICAEIPPTTCFMRDSQLITIGGFPAQFLLMPHVYIGWQVRVTGTYRTIHLYGDGDPSATIDTSFHTMTEANFNIGLQKFLFSNGRTDEPYTLEFCPPEEI
jgi:hypothetical protein